MRCRAAREELLRLVFASLAIFASADRALEAQRGRRVDRAPAGGLALVRVSVAPLREEPRVSAQMVDQVVMGDRLEILERKRGWARVRTPYGYEGWITSFPLAHKSERELREWKEAPLKLFLGMWGFVRCSASLEAEPLSDIVLGATVRSLRTEGRWTKVALPDGREGYLPSEDLGDPPASPATTAEGVVKLARSLQGIPYLWGGRSTKAFDCSGFTHTVYRMVGHLLPRDSSQQARIGKPVEWDQGFTSLRPGDLLFFGASESRITHVALSLGGPSYIHCAGDVHLASFDPADPLYDAQRRRSLRVVRRILP